MKNFKIGCEIKYQNEVFEVTDVDCGYMTLALGGDYYVAPDHPDNRSITATMADCVLVDSA